MEFTELPKKKNTYVFLLLNDTMIPRYEFYFTLTGNHRTYEENNLERV